MNTTEHNSDKPPFFGSWKALYWFVVGLLIFQIVLFYFFTQLFA